MAELLLTDDHRRRKARLLGFGKHGWDSDKAPGWHPGIPEDVMLSGPTPVSMEVCPGRVVQG